MKKILSQELILIALLLLYSNGLFCQTVSKAEAGFAASMFIQNRAPHSQIIADEALNRAGSQLGWVFNLDPQGFVIVPVTMDLPPVLAYSTESNFKEGVAWETFLPILLADIQTRLKYVIPGSEEAMKNNTKWDELLSNTTDPYRFQQWPPEGWSPTGGWLFTNWTQTAPYNNMCPMNPQTHQRSVAGCPATAMAQILNFHHTINNTRFSDADDYYHSFGAGNQFWIDDAWEERGFPSWPQLNEYLDTLDTHYLNQVPLTNDDKAAITYACGVAAKQVYSTSVSGTYGIDQAWDAFIRFGFSDAQLVYPSNPGLTSLLAQNIMMALPAQLGLVNPEGTAGHNVVVDGYNSDEMYHFNFGWGGSANGWYTMPPTSIPYNLTVIEGVVVDINLSNAPVGINTLPAFDDLHFIRYHSQSNTLNIDLRDQELQNFQLTVMNTTGQVILTQTLAVTANNHTFSINLPEYLSGPFIVTLRGNKGAVISQKFIRLTKF